MPTKKNKKQGVNPPADDRCRLFQEFMDAVPDAICFKDKKGRILFVNKAYAGEMHCSPEDLAGKTDFDIFPKSRAERRAREDKAVMQTGVPLIDKLERSTRSNGADRYVSITKIPRREASGKLTGTVGITRDVTKRVHNERLCGQQNGRMKSLQILEDCDRLKSEFISTVSHELRTPLATVTQLLLLIADEMAGPVNNRQHAILARAKNNLDRLKNIIDNLLDISRIEGKRLQLHYSLANLRDVFKESEAFFRSLAREKNITLRYSFPKEDVTIFIDVERVCQVVSNLIHNAVKFTDENGSITIEVKVLEQKVRVGVIDTGTGIAKKDIGRIFDKFIQVSSAEKTRSSGIGLGLSIVKEIVERHGGEIWVESRIGVGSKFYFTLPRFYAADILEKPVKDRIRDWLDAGETVHFINLLMVHYNDALRQRINASVPRLSQEVEVLMGKALKKISRDPARKRALVVSDARHGKYSILIAGASEKQIAGFCRSLKLDMKRYFVAQKIDDIFIAMGIGAYGKASGQKRRDITASNVNIREIYIGAEMRRFRRIAYKTTARVTVPGRAEVACQTLDISQGGLCIISPKRLKTNDRVVVAFQLLRTKKSACLEAGISWIYKMERDANHSAVRYKIGLEFLNLDGAHKNNLVKELELYYG